MREQLGEVLGRTSGAALVDRWKPGLGRMGVRWLGR
ncbi:hypothetical protein SAMN04489732_1502 [Amycolatopsis saalfeldensis]|uniref:Uncharacterized protein n=1 Tax=Amycolatopsis saalfeldensis TaxID=394193 RepID=A0A1H8YQT1_9PSEU|nr:hypothetical protein SAMN04489732_1502 [Amycolatopsis saalfeldensis]